MHDDAPAAMQKPAENMPAMHDTMPKTAMQHDSLTTAIGAGSYEPYTAAKASTYTQTGTVILFFHAPWCPLCVATEADITAHLADIPTGFHILKVDYDAATELKQRYGVTVQTTFVVLDTNQNKVSSWTGQSTLDDILQHTL